MAISFVSVGAVSSGAGAVTPGFPASGVAAGDIAILVVQSSNEAITTPAGGWTQVANSLQGTGTAATAGAVRVGAYWKLCNGTENGTTVTVNDTGNHTVAQILIYRGCETTSPIDVTAGGVKAAASTTSTNPSVTTTVADTMIVLISGTANDANSTANFSAWTNANLGSLTERIDRSVNTGTGGGFGVADGTFVGPGATGTTTATMTSARSAYITIALKPPQGTKFFQMF